METANAYLLIVRFSLLVLLLFFKSHFLGEIFTLRVLPNEGSHLLSDRLFHENPWKSRARTRIWSELHINSGILRVLICPGNQIAAFNLDSDFYLLLCFCCEVRQIPVRHSSVQNFLLVYHFFASRYSCTPSAYPFCSRTRQSRASNSRCDRS